MKLSVCIPAHNYCIDNLLKTIDISAVASGVSFEILIADDASAPEYAIHYQTSSKDCKATLFRFDTLQGRSGIRNRLAENARGEFLLFLDCDMVITDPNFVALYLKDADDYDVICGGISYQWSGFSSSDKKLLRYRYGVHREDIGAARRNTNPYGSFMTGNFLIRRHVLLDIRFNERLQGYGHEDTLFGRQLREGKFKIQHINNAAVHNGLDSDADFINKTRNGLENLAFLSGQGMIQPDDVRLLDIALNSKYKFHRIAAVVLNLLFKFGCRYLVCFDAWRLNTLKIILHKPHSGK